MYVWWERFPFISKNYFGFGDPLFDFSYGISFSMKLDNKTLWNLSP